MDIPFKIGSVCYHIRSFRASDKAAIIKYADNYNVARNLRDLFPHPYTEKDADEWLKTVLNQDPELTFAIADENELIGGIGLLPQEDVGRFEVEIGYWLGEPFWGKGIASEALKILTGYTFMNFQFNRIFAGVFEGNTASMRVLEKAGYKLEGIMRKSVYKEGKLLDRRVYAILREEFSE